MHALGCLLQTVAGHPDPGVSKHGLCRRFYGEPATGQAHIAVSLSAMQNLYCIVQDQFHDVTTAGGLNSA